MMNQRLFDFSCLPQVNAASATASIHFVQRFELKVQAGGYFAGVIAARTSATMSGGVR